MKFRHANTAPAVFGALLVGGALTTGCEQKEPIVNVETPAGNVEVERDTSSGDVEVDVTDKE